VYYLEQSPASPGKKHGPSRINAGQSKCRASQYTAHTNALPRNASLGKALRRTGNTRHKKLPT
jgi:hypothetical protein